MTDKETIAARVNAALLRKMEQIEGAPGAVISFEVEDGDWDVRVSIVRKEDDQIFLGGRLVQGEAL